MLVQEPGLDSVDIDNMLKLQIIKNRFPAGVLWSGLPVLVWHLQIPFAGTSVGDVPILRQKEGRVMPKPLHLVLAGVVAAGAGLFLALGPPKLLAKSESPEFCGSCHVMEAQYEAWLHQGAHRREACVECHLPNGDLASHYAWKTIDGMKDTVVFYSGHVPEEIRISDHGREVVRVNCVRCHETAVEMIDTGRPCWECHRRITHARAGAIATR